MLTGVKRSFWGYVKAAFNARPIGMFVPPNWVGLAGFAMLGLLNPGFWLLGAGAELAYLFGLSTSRRFQRLVDGSAIQREREARREQVDRLVSQLDPEDRDRFHELERRCQRIIGDQQSHVGTGGERTPAPELELQGEGLARLLWIYLRLLRTRQGIQRVLRESIDLDLTRDREPIDRRLARLRAALQGDALNPDLRKSMEGQADILEQRIARRRETREKLAFIDHELVRIEEQVELLREQAVAASDPASVSGRIDAVGRTLGDTQQWIRDQQQLFGRLDDLTEEPPPLGVSAERVTE
jgi:hypothetical protein